MTHFIHYLLNDLVEKHRKEFNRLSAKLKLMSKAAKKLTWEKKTGTLDLWKDSRKAWTLLDKLSGRRTNPEPIVIEYGKATTDIRKAEAFNNFYTTIKKQENRAHTDKAFKKLTRVMEKRNGPRLCREIHPTRQQLEEMQVEEGSRTRRGNQ